LFSAPKFRRAEQKCSENSSDYYTGQQNKYAEAEPVLRECLALRTRKEPEAWTTFNTQSLLGDALPPPEMAAELSITVL
jgi:hypothetical protein